MTFPIPAQRRSWFENNFESIDGHIPTAHLHGGRWRAACATDSCINPDDPGVYDHHDRADAKTQAVHILNERTHGPNDKETT